MTSSNEQLAPVEQIDRDAAADIWRDYIARTGEIIVERNMREGGLDEGLPALLARHRLAALRTPPAIEPDEGLVEPMAWVVDRIDLNGEHEHFLTEMPSQTLIGKVVPLYARAKVDEKGNALLNLLAVIHRDGGHKVQEIGWELAAKQAELIVADFYACPPAEPAAWLYEIPGANVQKVHLARLEKREGWTETPLYAHPPATPSIRAQALDEAAWLPIESAPYEQTVEIKVGSMTFLAALHPGVSEDDKGRSCDQWQAAVEGEHPACWSGGACWASNEDEIESLQPTTWRALKGGQGV